MPGDYAIIRVNEASGHTLRGTAIARTTLAQHASRGGDNSIDATKLAVQLAAARAARAEETDAVLRGTSRPSREDDKRTLVLN